MNILQNLKLDRWYSIVLYLGALLVLASLVLQIDFLKVKHLFGLGMGMAIVGLAFYIAEKVASAIALGGIISTTIIKHNIATIIMLIIGFALITLFGSLIVYNLI